VVYGEGTTWVFRAAPLLVTAATVGAVLLLPSRLGRALGFRYDLVLFAYLLGAARFATVLAALDTGSSFEGMGASRELLYGTLAEPALFLTLLCWSRIRARSRCRGYWAWRPPRSRRDGTGNGHAVRSAAGRVRARAVRRSQHALELTMVHEVMILDHSGPDLALLQYSGLAQVLGGGSAGGGPGAAGKRNIALAAGAALVDRLARWPCWSEWSNPPWRACGWRAPRSSWSAASLLAVLRCSSGWARRHEWTIRRAAGGGAAARLRDAGVQPPDHIDQAGGRAGSFDLASCH